MRIGLIAPPWVPVPPPAYGGTESVIDNLARGLAARGHEVRLFTVGESTCPVLRAHLFEHPVAPIGDAVAEAAHVLAAYEEFADADVVHDHTILGPLLGPRRRGAGAVGQNPPVVVTNHGPFTDATRRIFARIAERAAVVAISRDQAGRAAGVPITAVIHHGIDTDVYRPGEGSGDYLMFVGRMSPDKGVERAVRIAHAAGRPLLIASKMREPAEREYFEDRVRPLLTSEDLPPQEVPSPERIALLQEAAGLLNPIRWHEPFGLVMAESLALGTPVIASPRGAAPEIVTHGLTGFLCPTDTSAARAAWEVDRLDRETCRRVAEERFSVERMARDHEELYGALLEGRVPEQRRPVPVPLRRGSTAGSCG